VLRITFLFSSTISEFSVCLNPPNAISIIYYYYLSCTFRIKLITFSQNVSLAHQKLRDAHKYQVNQAAATNNNEETEWVFIAYSFLDEREIIILFTYIIYNSIFKLDYMITTVSSSTKMKQIIVLSLSNPFPIEIMFKRLIYYNILNRKKYPNVMSFFTSRIKF